MKKNLFILFVILISPTMYAQEAKTLKKQTTIEEAKYCCPKCDVCVELPGKCNIHNVYLVKQGNYYCEYCDIQNEDACKCYRCGVEMKRMNRSMKKTPALK